MKKFLSILLSLIFLLTLSLSILLTSVENTLLKARFHTNNLKEADLYEKVVTEIVPTMLLESEDSPMQELPLSKEDLGEIIQKSLPETWLEQEVEKNLTNIFAYVKGKESKLTLNVELKSVKTSFTQEFTKNLQNKLEQLPSCSPEQLQQLQTGTVTELECLPPQLAQGAVSQELTKQLSGMTQNIPDKIDLTEEIPPTMDEQFKKIQEGYQLFKYAQWGLIAATAVLFIILLLINKSTIVKYLKNISLAVAIISGVCFGVLQLISSNSVLILQQIPNTDTPALDNIRDNLISTTLSNFLKYISQTKLIVFAISAAIFVIIIIKNNISKPSTASRQRESE